MLDIASFLEHILTSTSAHLVTNLFLFIIIIVFSLSLAFAMLGFGRVFTSYTPGLLTSLGILGTFIGIVIGLLDFDPKNIDSSIELLLDGLKTAFITSLAGMAGAILYKLMGATPLFKENRITGEPIDVEPKDILLALRNQEKHLVALKEAISGQEESSLVGQIKRLRIDINDNHRDQQDAFKGFSNELWLNLQNFSEMLSKSATEQVVLALKEVISDFNKNLTEQFGDNFKALDASVKKLVDWQSQYSDQLEHMMAQYAEGVKAISDIEQSVSKINEESKEIPHTMRTLKSVLEVNQHQIGELSRHLAAFQEMKEQAVQAVPEMQKQVEKTVEEIARSARQANKGYQVLLDSTENVQKSFIGSIERVQNTLELTVSELVEKQMGEMNRSFHALEEEVSKSVELTGRAVNKQLTMIDESMNQEVSRVMTEMGQALARISGQFTSDYQELTLAMKKITNMSKR